jgi:hypothetical protein
MLPVTFLKAKIRQTEIIRMDLFITFLYINI